jgi:hypothetical protein
MKKLIVTVLTATLTSVVLASEAKKITIDVKGTY